MNHQATGSPGGRWLPWREAWQLALYGPDGFYRRPHGPGRHFATAAQGISWHAANLYAAAVVELARRHEVEHVVDLGCGHGELVAQVASLAPDLRCTGVDVVSRPPGLSRRVGWWQSPGGADLPDELCGLSDSLVIANEWLDVVPCTVAEPNPAAQWRQVEVDLDTGSERLGGELDAADRAWCEAHWPADLEESSRGAPDAALRVEVGASRDLAFGALCDRVDRGVVLAVDYGHLRSGRPRHGTLAAYQNGRMVPPRPDGSCDLTAHVAVDSLPADEVVRQRTALHRLGTQPRPPARDLAGRDPAAYLQALATVSAAAVLSARGGLGDFWWATRVLP